LATIKVCIFALQVADDQIRHGKLTTKLKMAES